MCRLYGSAGSGLAGVQMELDGAAADAVDSLVIVVLQGSGAGAHRVRARPGFHDLPLRAQAHPELAAVVCLNRPAR